MTIASSRVLPEVSLRVVEEGKDIKKDIRIKQADSFCDRKICRMAWDIISVVVFPIGLVRFSIRVIAPNLVLPATTMFNTAGKTKKEISEINQINNFRKHFISHDNIERIAIQTSDGVEIDTVKIKNDKSDKWIVYFCPNAACYEQHLAELEEISERTGANVYTGNYRGVMCSKGRIQSTNDMVLDGKAMVEKLLSEGVPQENILIHGLSIGGGVATEVASNYPKVHLCSDRSFGSLVHFLDAQVPIIGSMLGRIASIAGWGFNSAENFQKIEGKKLVIYSEDDGVVLLKGSLYNVLKNKNIELKSISLKVTQADFIRRYGKNHATEYASALGMISHGYPLEAIESVFEGYLDFVKDALKLA